MQRDFEKPEPGPMDHEGRPHGEWQRHYENGALLYSENWQHGKLHGEKRTYFTNGRLARQETFNLGTLIRRKLFLFDGTQVLDEVTPHQSSL